MAVCPDGRSSSLSEWRPLGTPARPGVLVLPSSQPIFQARLRSLEATAEEDKRQAVQVELLKQEKSKLLSQLAAQESVIEGLRAERKLWGQELAQQGRRGCSTKPGRLIGRGSTDLTYRGGPEVCYPAAPPSGHFFCIHYLQHDMKNVDCST